MADSFGARARRFMGWPTAEDEYEEMEVFDEVEQDDAQIMEVTPLERPSLQPVRVEREQVEADLSRIVTVHPSAYSDAVTIGEAFRSGTPVIINLTDMSESDARRLIDFAAGLTFGMHGIIERVTNRVFLLSPKSVEVTGDISGSRRGSLFNQG